MKLEAEEKRREHFCIKDIFIVHSVSFFSYILLFFFCPLPLFPYFLSNAFSFSLGHPASSGRAEKFISLGNKEKMALKYGNHAVFKVNYEQYVMNMK